MQTVAPDGRVIAADRGCCTLSCVISLLIQFITLDTIFQKSISKPYTLKDQKDLRTLFLTN